MDHQVSRARGRQFDQLRDIQISYNVFGYAPGSVLFELGNTKILCSVSIQVGVPPFLKGTKTGWLTAEYAMLPTSGHSRSNRESSQAKRNERSVEISRLIGRSLRAIVNLSTLGERTIYVDCDVLQADGSTRTASITGAYLALKMAEQYWLESREISQSFLTDAVAAVSAGFAAGKPLLDLDYAEDSAIDADYNFVLTQSQKIIEIQGAAEKSAITWQQFDVLRELAIKGNQKLFELMEQSLKHAAEYQPATPASFENKGTMAGANHKNKSAHEPLFSLKNRLANAP